jgi:hypothetical protein
VQRLLVIDTSILYKFCEMNKHDRLKTHLQDSARITLEVEVEIRRNSKEVRHLGDLLTAPEWPTRVGLSPSQLQEVLDVADAERKVLGGFTKEDYGEISTVIWARDTCNIAIVDDKLGRHLAELWDVEYRRGHHLIPGMVHKGLLTLDEAVALWMRFQPSSTRQKCEAACERYRQDCQ